MIGVRIPAGLEDVVALNPSVIMPSAYWRALLVQLRAGASACFLDELERPLLVVGLFPVGRGAEALWLAAAPEAAKRMVGLTRALRLTLARACQGRSIVLFGYVAPGHRSPARLLALLGFRRDGRDHGFDRWVREYGGQE
jgi:hypothetical protein